MPTIRERVKKDGKRVFHTQVRVAGFPARTASFTTRRAAERCATTIEAEMIEGKHFRSVEARRRTLAEAIDRYLAEVAAAASATPGRGTARLLWWKEQLGHLKLAEITPAILVEYRGKLSREPFTRAKPDSKRSIIEGETPHYTRTGSTVNRYPRLPIARAHGRAASEWHWVSHNPFDGVSKLSEGHGRVRFLSEDERKRLLKETAKDATLHTFVVLALSTAARAGELWNLHWPDVDLSEGLLLLRVTKNTQPRTAWVQGEAMRLLTEHGKVRRLGDDRVFVSPTGRRYRYDKAFSSACEAANVERFRFHDLRHSAATYLAREGATEQQLRAIGGWKSAVVNRYVHLAAADTKAVVAKMNEKILGK